MGSEPKQILRMSRHPHWSRAKKSYPVDSRNPLVPLFSNCIDSLRDLCLEMNRFLRRCSSFDRFLQLSSEQVCSIQDPILMVENNEQHDECWRLSTLHSDNLSWLERHDFPQLNRIRWRSVRLEDIRLTNRGNDKNEEERWNDKRIHLEYSDC